MLKEESAFSATSWQPSVNAHKALDAISTFLSYGLFIGITKQKIRLPLFNDPLPFQLATQLKNAANP